VFPDSFLSRTAPPKTLATPVCVHTGNATYVTAYSVSLSQCKYTSVFPDGSLSQISRLETLATCVCVLLCIPHTYKYIVCACACACVHTHVCVLRSFLVTRIWKFQKRLQVCIYTLSTYIACACVCACVHIYVVVSRSLFVASIRKCQQLPYILYAYTLTIMTLRALIIMTLVSDKISSSRIYCSHTLL